MNGANDRFDFTDPVPPLEDLGAVHFIAIGGAGMSGVARVMLARGCTVSGSDAKESPVLAALQAEGATVHVGHAAVPPRRGADRRHLLGHPRGQPRAGGRPVARAARPAPFPGPGQHDGRLPPGRGRRGERQDHDHVDAHGGAAALRDRPVVRRRGRAGQARHQRAPGDRRRLRRRGRRERRLVPGLPPRGRRRHQRPARPPRLLRHLRDGSRPPTPRSPPPSSPVACSSPATTTRGPARWPWPPGPTAPGSSPTASTPRPTSCCATRCPAG